MSMRRRLLVALLSSVLLAGLLATVFVFYQARQQANALFDYQLRQLAITLRDRTYSQGPLSEALQGAQGLDFVIQVWGPDAQILYASHPSLSLPAPTTLGFSDADTRLGTWRVYTTWHQGLTIQVAQHRLAREALALGVAMRTLAPFLLVLPLMGVLIWKLVGREVKVLERTAQAVAKRTPESLEPIGHEAVPEEVRPLVDALNGLMARLGGALAQQRQFIADAAHELRTPLTALRLQLQLAERARDDTEREKAHAMLREGIARATHVVEQLLTLARADPEATTVPRTQVDLSALARSVAQGLSLEAQAPEPVFVEGDAAALRTLMENLADNAARYAPPASVVLRTYRRDDGAIFEVEDAGPGIPLAERERVFDRFYRSESGSSIGTGLGLSIARRIAERHGGKIELRDPPSGKGLLARVVIPAQAGTQ